MSFTKSNIHVCIFYKCLLKGLPSKPLRTFHSSKMVAKNISKYKQYCRTTTRHIGRLVQERCNFVDNALEIHLSCRSPSKSGCEVLNWMHLSVRQVDCKNHVPECTIHLSEIYKANATYFKIRNMQLSVGQVQVFHLSDCHFYSSQTIGRVKFRTLDIV